MRTQTSSQIMDEIHLLSQFDLHSMQQGIKVHANAESNVRQACQRLYEKGLVDQIDGGYLTHRGIETAKHAQILLDALNNHATTAMN